MRLINQWHFTYIRLGWRVTKLTYMCPVQEQEEAQIWNTSLYSRVQVQSPRRNPPAMKTLNFSHALKNTVAVEIQKMSEKLPSTQRSTENNNSPTHGTLSQAMESLFWRQAYVRKLEADMKPVSNHNRPVPCTTGQLMVGQLLLSIKGTNSSCDSGSRCIPGSFRECYIYTPRALIAG